MAAWSVPGVEGERWRPACEISLLAFEAMRALSIGLVNAYKCPIIRIYQISGGICYGVALFGLEAM